MHTYKPEVELYTLCPKKRDSFGDKVIISS